MELLPLRAFLGITFVYAGVQKLSDPGFLHKGSGSYIGTQLHEFARGTPGGFLLRAFPVVHPQLAGVAVAFTEIGVGLLVLVGLATRIAAVVGMSLNLVLFLTASWHTVPYFLGSDIVFVFAWTPFVLVGARGQPALDHQLARGGRPALAGGPTITRREVMGRALAVTGATTLVLGGIAAALKGRYRGGPRVHTLASSSQAPPTVPATPSPPSSAAPPGATRLGPSSRLPNGEAALYHDPGDGSADIVIRQSSGALTAFSAVCTHAGCDVTYESGGLVCPCHGSVFNAETGAVEQGPAVEPLPSRRVLERGGDIYAFPA